MIKDKKILAVIPARGGSKGIPKKNIKMIAGKPLIAWTIEAAKQSKYIDRLIVSSDDDEIIRVACEWNCEAPFVRPAELALDSTPGVSPVLHAIAECPGYDYVVLLQPTSPLRTVEDIDGCIEQCVSEGESICVTVCEAEQSPLWMYQLSSQKSLSPYLSQEKEIESRQGLPVLYVMNGAVYVADCNLLKKMNSYVTEYTTGYIMPGERSMDIDDQFQFDIVEFLLMKTTA